MPAFDVGPDGTLAPFDEVGFEVFGWTGFFVDFGEMVGLTGFEVVAACVGDGVTAAGQKAPLAGVTSATFIQPI